MSSKSDANDDGPVEMETHQVSEAEELTEIYDGEIDTERYERKLDRLAREEKAWIILESAWAGDQFFDGLGWKSQLDGQIVEETDRGVKIRSESLASRTGATASEWFPKSQIDMVIKPEPEENKLLFTDDIDDPESGTFEDAEFCITGTYRNHYGFKIAIDFPGPDEELHDEIKSDLMELDFQETHRTWDDDNNTWSADRDSVKDVVEHMVENGWTVAVNPQFL